MLVSMSKTLNGLRIEATDGENGGIKEFYFDEFTFMIFHVIVETGTWMETRQVCVSPSVLGPLSADGKRVAARVSKAEIENSPRVRTDRL